jgi:hypothetical protein
MIVSRLQLAIEQIDFARLQRCQSLTLSSLPKVRPARFLLTSKPGKIY